MKGILCGAGGDEKDILPYATGDVSNFINILSTHTVAYTPNQETLPGQPDLKIRFPKIRFIPDCRTWGATTLSSPTYESFSHMMQRFAENCTWRGR